jgi:heme-dependent oxidative N-demethylase alpha subunit-like protein
MLEAPARYFPIRNGRYEVAPNLRPLGTDFGHGAADGRVFQIDWDFPRYRENKLRCRAERLSKYVGLQDLKPTVAAASARFVAARLAQEYPSLFAWEADGDGSGRLECRLTRERLAFDPEMCLADVEAEEPAEPAYADAWDALACQVPEDLALVCTGPEGRDRLTAFHVCSPSHWSAEEKLGRDFAAVHAPVPGMEPVLRVAGSMVDAMVHRGPFVRFVWSISGDRRLNGHPEPPPGVPLSHWRHPAFDPAMKPPFYLRVERQVTWGLPEVGAAVFVIRLSFTDAREIRANPEERRQLLSALRSMSPESRRYKGIFEVTEGLVEWLEEARG